MCFIQEEVVSDQVINANIIREPMTYLHHFITKKVEKTVVPGGLVIVVFANSQRYVLYIDLILVFIEGSCESRQSINANPYWQQEKGR